MIAAVKTMTLDEFLAWQDLPENAGRQFELIRGEVFEMPRPTKRHGGICSRVSVLLSAYIDSCGKGYVASNDSGVVLQLDPPTLRGPDLMFFAEAPSDEELDSSAFQSHAVPTLVVEVLSPTVRDADVAEKIQEYLKAGVSLVWSVDYAGRTVSVFKRGSEPRNYGIGETLDGNGLLPNLSIPVSEIFRMPGKK